MAGMEGSVMHIASAEGYGYRPAELSIGGSFHEGPVARASGSAKC
jgi:hypothetical protein